MSFPANAAPVWATYNVSRVKYQMIRRILSGLFCFYSSKDYFWNVTKENRKNTWQRVPRVRVPRRRGCLITVSIGIFRYNVKFNFRVISFKIQIRIAFKYYACLCCPLWMSVILSTILHMTANIIYLVNVNIDIITVIIILLYVKHKFNVFLSWKCDPSCLFLILMFCRVFFWGI